MKIQLISPLPDEGYAFNAGAYWPVGLLTIATVLQRRYPDLHVEILDENLIGPSELDRRLGGDIVGIQASSILTYRRVVEIVRRAKARGCALTIVGGPYATTMAPQIIQHRPCVDLVVEGAGELPMVSIVDHWRSHTCIPEVWEIPGVWSRLNGAPKEPPSVRRANWNYDQALPLNYALISVPAYHANYRRLLARGPYVGAFQIFTHFGCRYRDARRMAAQNWCLYCALGDSLELRAPDCVRREIEETLLANAVGVGAHVMLKCYGDNASAIGGHLNELAGALASSAILGRYRLAWSVYAQSCYVTERLIDVFSRLGVAEVYIGFDSVDDRVQKLNGLGTTAATHLRAAKLLRDAGIRVQAGFVLGCEGETNETLNATYEFCLGLAKLGNVDLFHASPLVVLPGSTAFARLASADGQISSSDYVSPDVLQREWLRRFCPGLGSPIEAQRVIHEMAKAIADLAQIRSAWGQREALMADVE